MRELNETYKHVKQQSLIIALTFLPLSLLFFMFLPIGMDNIGMIVFGIWCFLQAFIVYRNPEYFSKRAKILPESPSPNAFTNMLVFAGVFIVVLALVFMIIESDFSYITTDGFFETHEAWFTIVEIIVVMAFTVGITMLIRTKGNA